MKKPWVTIPKTFRDELYDIIAHITSYLAETNQPLANGYTCSDTAERLGQDLFEVERNWQQSLPRTLHTLVSDLGLEKQQEETMDLQDCVSADAILLKLEFITARLLFALLPTYSAVSQNQLEHVYFGQEPRARNILMLPLFQQHHSRVAGILESHCRSSFTIWVLRQLETQRRAQHDFLVNVERPWSA